MLHRRFPCIGSELKEHRLIFLGEMPEQEQQTHTSAEVPQSLSDAMKLVGNIEFKPGTLPKIIENLLSLSETEAKKRLPWFANGVQKIMGSLEETLRSGRYISNSRISEKETELVDAAGKLTEYSYFVDIAKKAFFVSDGAVSYAHDQDSLSDHGHAQEPATDERKSENTAADHTVIVDQVERIEHVPKQEEVNAVRDKFNTSIERIWSVISKLPGNNREQWYSFVRDSVDKTNQLRDKPKERIEAMESRAVALDAQAEVLLKWLSRQRASKLQQPGKEIYVMTKDGLEKGEVILHDGKLWVGNRNEEWFVPYDDIASNERGDRYVWDSSELEQGSKPERLSFVPMNMEAEFIQRKFDFLERNATLSKEEYAYLFGGSLRQANVGNCYLIASFVALQTCDHAEALIRSSVRKTPDGYMVRIPLGAKTSPEVRVTDGDMRALQLAGNRYLGSIDAATGWKLLEAAFTLKFHGRDALGIIDRKKSEGGLGYEALTQLMHGANSSHLVYKYYGAGKSLNEMPERKQNAIEFLDSYTNGKVITTCGSISDQSGVDTKIYAVGDHTFYHNHAYCIRRVNSQAKQVVVINPHDSSQEITLTYNQFMSAFEMIDGIRLDHRAMFQS